MRVVLQDGGWQTDNCDSTYQFLCEADKRPSEKPTTTPQVPGCQPVSLKTIESFEFIGTNFVNFFFLMKSHKDLILYVMNTRCL